MKITSTSILSSRAVSVLSGAVLAVLWLSFAMRHVHAYLNTGHIVFLVFCISETMQSSFMLIRTKPQTVSTELYDWVLAVLGTFISLGFSPGGVVLWSGGMTLLVIGFSLQIIGLISLNRSFALVAAKREIKTAFGYRVVRHPMYASYSVGNIGYFLFNASLWNALCLAFILVLFILRIIQEEKHLSQDPIYREYKARVRYRLIPYVY